MRWHLLSITTATLVALNLIGCATAPAPVPEPEHVEIKLERVTRGLTLAWDNMGRGGAAVRQPAYVHVLGDGDLGSSRSLEGGLGDLGGYYTPSGPLDLAKLDSGRGQEAGRSDAYNNAGRAYSIYELSRWERYCQGGVGMDEADWTFITENGGRNNVPPMLQNHCRVPTHDYADYLTAWTSFCTDQPITKVQREIVQKSVRPQSRVNPCEALNP